MQEKIHAIFEAEPVSADEGRIIGRSREGRPIRAFGFGSGDRRVSLLGGCHADEPVGPRLLSQLCQYLSRLPDKSTLLTQYQWWIVPHINPDGAERNSAWQGDAPNEYDIGKYLAHRVRELPGDDIEFGFPRGPDDEDARPENLAVYEWWSRAENSFSLHVSLHGMGFAAGPWFLIEAAWQDRCSELEAKCASSVTELGYTMHDVQRNGEKGFFRLGRGFCTRPDSRYMIEHFLDLGDEKTAALFRPSSMETVRSFGGDTLTLVSEMPLFITPGVGEDLGPPDPVAEEWKRRIGEWSSRLQTQSAGERDITEEARELGLRAMPVRDQMKLQWTFIVAGLEQIALSE